MALGLVKAEGFAVDARREEGAQVRHATTAKSRSSKNGTRRSFIQALACVLGLERFERFLHGLEIVPEPLKYSLIDPQNLGSFLLGELFRLRTLE